MRYRLHHHPAFPGPLSKEDLYLLVERGALARGDLCTDLRTGGDHTVGEVIRGLHPARAHAVSRLERPAYQEFRTDLPPGVGEIAIEPLNDEDEEDEFDEDTEEAYTDSGERILHRSRPAWLGYGKALFLALLLIVAGGLLLFFDPVYTVICGLLALALISTVAIARHTREYWITEERVEVVWGLLGRSSKEVRIRDIRSIDVEEVGLKGLIGLGNVHFTSAAHAGIDVTFRNIYGTHDIKELVRRLQREAENPATVD